jgi:membrane protease YdiL (CAAX protease family)
MDEWIGIATGTCLCVIISVIFVSSLYVWDWIDPQLKRLSRDHPSVIRRRTISVVLSSIIGAHLTHIYTGEFEIGRTSIKSLSTTFIQILILMIGPIVDKSHEQWRFPSIDFAFVRTTIIAPIFEEFVFRQCFHRILLTSGYTEIAALFVSPFLFACAHVHHHVHSRDLKYIAAQTIHTCVFGWLGGYLLVYRSLWDAILAHAVCNFIGLPSYSTKTFPIRVSLYAVGLVTFLGSIIL